MTIAITKGGTTYTLNESDSQGATFARIVRAHAGVGASAEKVNGVFYTMARDLNYLGDRPWISRTNSAAVAIQESAGPAAARVNGGCGGCGAVDRQAAIARDVAPANLKVAASASPSVVAPQENASLVPVLLVIVAVLVFLHA